jgi:hypothetical protein
MTLSMYDASVPVLIAGFENLTAILQKAEKHADAKQIDFSTLLNARLAPDMYPLIRQIQIASDNAKGCAARLAGVEIPSYADTETTLPEIYARIEKTIGFLKSIDPATVNGSADREVIFKSPHGDRHFKGADYLTSFALPNFYFHIAMAYALLRHNGVDIGKRDFLGLK